MLNHFSIDLLETYWINNSADDPNDLCLHGNIKIRIGFEEFYYEEATVSASALYFMKSIYEDHIINEELQFIPHCGFSIYKRDNSDTVDIIGCPLGIDWSVYHEDNLIRIVTESNNTTIIEKEAYIEEIFKYADTIEQIYKDSKEKNLPTDNVDLIGYQTFWKEWFYLRENSN